MESPVQSIYHAAFHHARADCQWLAEHERNYGCWALGALGASFDQHSGIMPSSCQTDEAGLSGSEPEDEKTIWEGLRN